MRSRVTHRRAEQGQLPLPPVKKPVKRKPNVPALAREDMRWLLEPLLLSILEHRQTAYGYQLAAGIYGEYFGIIGFAESSVYGALKRFERKGWVYSYIATDEYHDARYYVLTDRGRERAAERRAALGQAAMYALQALELPFIFQPNKRRCEAHVYDFVR